MKYRAFLAVQEAAYMGNIGFAEMVRFYKKASESEIEEMEKTISNGNWHAFKSLIKKVLGVDLQEQGQNVHLAYQGDTKMLRKDDEEEEEE